MSVFVAWPSCAVAQAQDPTDVITTYMAQDRLPSLSVAVGRPGEILCAAAFGLADVESSAPAVMQLSEQGLLDLDIPVQANCASFPDKVASITPHQLLAHLGGIRHYNYRRFREEFLSSTRYESVNDALGVFKDDALADWAGFH